MSARAVFAVVCGVVWALGACSEAGTEGDGGEQGADSASLTEAPRFGADAQSTSVDAEGAGTSEAASTALEAQEDTSEPAQSGCALLGDLCDDGDCCTLGDSCQACDVAGDPDCEATGLKCVGSPACVDEDDTLCTLTECGCNAEGATPHSYTG